MNVPLVSRLELYNALNNRQHDRKHNAKQKNLTTQNLQSGSPATLQWKIKQK